MKTLAKTLIRMAPLPMRLQEKILFYGKCGYWPNFKNPRSFNEKVNWRKLNSSNQKYVHYCDKLKVRDYVRDKIGEEFLIPVLYEGESISAEAIRSLGDDIVVKTNHDSGSVWIIRKNFADRADEVAAKAERSLESNYGMETNEWWYSRVPPKVFVEKFLEGEEGETPFDVKFFVFRHGSGKPKTVIEVDHKRGTPDHHRTFYSEEGDILFFNGVDVRLDNEPNHLTPFPCPEHLDEMRQIAIRLSEGFSHVRVDLYNVGGRTYFGEMTFSDGGGRSRWTPRAFDFHMGELWGLEREPGGSERPDELEAAPESCG